MPRRTYTMDHLKFLLIAALLMVVLSFMLTDKADDMAQETVEEAFEEAREMDQEGADDMAGMPPMPVAPPTDVVDVALDPAKDGQPVAVSDDGQGAMPLHPKLTDEEPPLWERNALRMADVPAGWSKVAIIIDDMGASAAMTERVFALPGPLTLAFLPQYDGVADLMRAVEGHELMVHMPMEATNGDLESGDYVLKRGMDEDAFKNLLSGHLDRLEGYVGVNNHMGSALTQDEQAMRWLMEVLYERGLLFVDSRTIHTSVAADMAAAYKVPYEERDVFIDHYDTEEGAKEALAEIERVAKEHGAAVAIGHPKSITIEALAAWLPTLAEKQIMLVPISDLVSITPDELTQIVISPEREGDETMIAPGPLLDSVPLPAVNLNEFPPQPAQSPE